MSQADRHIADDERNITAQAALLDKLRTGGHDTITAEQTLKGFEEALRTLRDHREEIIKMIEQIDWGLA